MGGSNRSVSCYMMGFSCRLHLQRLSSGDKLQDKNRDFRNG